MYKPSVRDLGTTDNVFAEPNVDNSCNMYAEKDSDWYKPHLSVRTTHELARQVKKKSLQDTLAVTPADSSKIQDTLVVTPGIEVRSWDTRVVTPDFHPQSVLRNKVTLDPVSRRGDQGASNAHFVGEGAYPAIDPVTRGGSGFKSAIDLRLEGGGNQAIDPSQGGGFDLVVEGRQHLKPVLHAQRKSSFVTHDPLFAQSRAKGGGTPVLSQPGEQVVFPVMETSQHLAAMDPTMCMMEMMKMFQQQQERLSLQQAQDRKDQLAAQAQEWAEQRVREERLAQHQAAREERLE